MSEPTKPVPVKPSRSTRIQWGFLFWTSVALTGMGLWVSWFDPSSRLGSPFIATALGMLALYTSMRTWWVLQTLTEALGKTTAGFQQALRATSDAVHAPESAAERLAAPAGGPGHPRPAERLSGPEEAG